MKRIISTILLTILCIVSFSQTFEWKRLSDDVVDSVYNQAVFTTNNITLKNQNYYFAYTIFPYEDNWVWPNIFKSGYTYPTILSQDNQIVMADTLYLDSIFLNQNIATTFIQNDTFRVIINYPVLDSATYRDNIILRKGIPVPKTNGFLLINYSLTGGFLGYDSLALPPAVEHLANLNGSTANRALYVKDLFVNSQQEVFIHLGYWLRGGGFGPTYPLDTTGFIIKYNSDLTVNNKIIPVMLKHKDYDFPINLKLYNDNLYLLGNISDSVIVDNILFSRDTTAGLHTFALEFDRNLFVLQNHKLPGEYNDFAIDESGHLFTLARFNYPVFINPDSIIPQKVFVASIDSFVHRNYGLLNKLDNNFNSMYYSYFSIPVINNSKFIENENRIFITEFYNGYDTLVDNYPGLGGKENLSFEYDTLAGMFYYKNGDSLESNLIHHFSENLVLLNPENLVPIWNYDFPESTNVHNLYFNSDKMLMSFDGSYIYLSGFGDTDTVKVYNYYPVALSQINITGLGFEEMSGSEAAPLVAYPNPASDQLFLKLPENDDFVVSVFDLNGKRQLEQFLSNGENTLNVSALNTGLYIIRAQNKKQILTGKFLKE